MTDTRIDRASTRSPDGGVAELILECQTPREGGPTIWVSLYSNRGKPLFFKSGTRLDARFDKGPVEQLLVDTDLGQNVDSSPNDYEFRDVDMVLGRLMLSRRAAFSIYYRDLTTESVEFEVNGLEVTLQQFSETCRNRIHGLAAVTPGSRPTEAFTPQSYRE